MEENINKKNSDDEVISNEVKILKTDEDAKDGQNKCPKCGSTDISLNVKKGMLRCNFCRYEFEAEKAIGVNDDVHDLKGEVLGSATQDITADVKDILTFKCSSCGAEVVIDTAEAPQARCHWCRNTLSVNQQIPNGSIPDMVLPFKVSKDDAKKEIEKFVGKRKFFANSKFKEEFTTENIMGVYLPYMVLDVNSHSKLVGQGEHLVRRYTRGSKDNRTTYYDADLYDVEREFDLLVDDLTIESSSDKLEHNKSGKTNNVINAIMPFDTENCVKWDANYLKGYTSEKRDTNIEQLRGLVEMQVKDIARHKANEVLKKYDRGVSWKNEMLEVKGQKWVSSYLPIWLYSYQQIKGNDKKLLHYVAVNARSKETMGSIPINKLKLFFVSFLVEILGLLAMLFVDFDYNWLFLLSGFIYYTIYYNKYRNVGARHKHESETKASMENVKKKDDFVRSLKRLRNSRMNGANNEYVSGKSNFNNQILSSITGQSNITDIITDNISKISSDK